MRAPLWTRSGVASVPLVLALTLAPALVTAAPAAAQEEERCRCVDRNGDVIENCSCMRSFNFEGNPDVGVFSRTWRRSMIGVTISYDQGDDLDRQGARIEEVQDDGPADEAGFMAGDIVVRVDGRSVFDPLENRAAERAIDMDRSVPVQRFVSIVGQLEPDEPVEFEVLRDGRTRTLTVTPEDAQLFGALNYVGPNLRFDPDGLRGSLEDMGQRWNYSIEPRVFQLDSTRAGAFRFFGDSLVELRGDALGFRRDLCSGLGTRSGQANVWVIGGGNCVEGVELLELNPELGEYFGTERGVLVSEVAEESPLGLRPGDVLLAIDGREVTDIEDVRRILRSYEDDEEFRLRVRRHGNEMEVLGRRQ